MVDFNQAFAVFNNLVALDPTGEKGKIAKKFRSIQKTLVSDIARASKNIDSDRVLEQTKVAIQKSVTAVIKAGKGLDQGKIGEAAEALKGLPHAVEMRIRRKKDVAGSAEEIDKALATIERVKARLLKYKSVSAKGGNLAVTSATVGRLAKYIGGAKTSFKVETADNGGKEKVTKLLSNISSLFPGKA